MARRVVAVDGSCCCGPCDITEPVPYCVPPLSGFSHTSKVGAYTVNGRRVILEPHAVEPFNCQWSGEDVSYAFFPANLSHSVSFELYAYASGVAVLRAAGFRYITSSLTDLGGTFTLDDIVPFGWTVPGSITITATPGECVFYCPEDTVWCVILDDCQFLAERGHEDGSTWIGSNAFCNRGRAAIITIQSDGIAWVWMTPIGFSAGEAVYSGPISCTEETELALVLSTGHYIDHIQPDWPTSLRLVPGGCPIETGTGTGTTGTGTGTTGTGTGTGTCTPPNCSGGSYTAVVPAFDCMPSGASIGMADIGGGSYLAVGPPAALLNTSVCPATFVLDVDGDNAKLGQYVVSDMTCGVGGTATFVSGTMGCAWPATIPITTP